jgi:hypothetical protein
MIRFYWIGRGENINSLRKNIKTILTAKKEGGLLINEDKV